jgi:arylsulfatase A-like enzyme
MYRASLGRITSATRTKFLPTVHGFDEFFGNLYHLNAEEEPEDPLYPKDPRFKEMFGPRGVLKSWVTDKEDATDEKRWGVVGKQKIEDTGALTKKRMETVDEEFVGGALDFIERQAKADKPFFCWVNTTRMHVWTHLKPESDGVTGLGIYPDGMVELDGYVGQLLDKLDELGIADNTVVVFTTDNGAEVLSYPDGGQTPFRGEKATNWEGGFRVPCLIRWPGVIKPGTIINDVCAHEDFIPTFAAANGDTDLVERLKKGNKLNGKSFKVHLDGHNLLPFFSGKEKESPREGFMYWSDDGDLLAIRARQYKVTFMQQDGEASPRTPVGVWQNEFTKLRVPNLYDLRSDPFERGTNSIYYADWQVRRVFVQVPVQAIVAKVIESFKEFPPRAKAASFTVSDVMEKIGTASASAAGGGR